MESHFPQMERDASRHAREMVVDDMHRLMSDTEMLLKATAHDVNDKVQRARQRVIDALDEAKASCAAVTRRADNTIRTHPYQLMGLAAAAGFLTAYLWDQKK